MSRTVKQDIDLLFDIKKQVTERMNPDFTQISEVDQVMHYVDLIFENQNKWLISDKISNEKQSRMDQFKSNKDAQATTAPGGGEDVPTPKQISYATTLGIDVEGKGYGKKELSRLIDEAVKEQRKK